jgi:hypothetical protein
MSIEIDDVGVRRTLEDGKLEAVRWDQLRKVEIHTTSSGPFTDDVFWVLIGDSLSSGCVVPSESEAAKELLHRLQQLPEFDNGAVIKAMGCTDDATFVAWLHPMYREPSDPG